MADKRDNLQLNPAFRADGWVLLIFLTLLAFGWLSVCGASHSFGGIDFLVVRHTSRQTISLDLLLSRTGSRHSHVRRRYFDMLADLFYWGMMLLLLVTPFYCA